MRTNDHLPGRPAVRAAASMLLLPLALATSSPASAQLVVHHPFGMLVAGGAEMGDAQSRLFGCVGPIAAAPSDDDLRIAPAVGALLNQATTLVVSVDVTAVPGRGVAVSASLDSPFGADAVAAVAFRRTGDREYTRAAFAGSDEPGKTHGGVLPAEIASERGIDYVITTDSGPFRLTFPEGASEAVPGRIPVRLEGHAPEELGTEAETYRMVAFAASLDHPDRPDRVFGDDLGPHDRDRWRLLRWSPASGRYEEHDDGTTLPEVEPGRAYWLVTREAGNLDLDGWSPVPPPGGYEVRLEAGWNQIANPYAFPVALGAIVVEVGQEVLTLAQAVERGWLEENPLHAYVDHRYVTSGDRLEPWSGYFVANLDPGRRTMTWRVPDVAAPDGRPGSTPTPEWEGWRLHLVAQQGRAAEEVTVGTAAGADDRLERSDALAAPGSPGGDLSFSLVGGQSRGFALSRDIRGESVMQRWTAHLEGGTKGETTVSAALEGALPVGTSLAIVDQQTGRRYDLSSGRAEFALGLSSGTRPLEIVLGPAAPGVPATGLGPIQPNPAREFATLTFALAGDGPAELQVFDAAGRRVRALLARGERAGIHTLVWDGRDDRGTPLPGGTYFVRLTAAGEHHTARVTLLH